MQIAIQANPQNHSEFLDLLFVANGLRTAGYGVTVFGNQQALGLTTDAPREVVSAELTKLVRA